MSSLLCSVALLLTASFQSGESTTEDSWEANHYNPPALPLTGYADPLSGRLASDGTLDTGLVRLRFVQGTEGVPLDVTDVGYGKGPQLWAQFSSTVGDVDLHAVCLGIAERAGQDKRLIVTSQVKFSNPTDAPRKIVVSADLLPAHESPLRTSVPFDATAEWSRDGRIVVRDGQVVAGWVGPEPEVELREPTDSPDAPVARLIWRIEVPAGGVRYIEVKLAGPPGGASVDEAAWRRSFGRRSYVVLEESLRWEGQARGTITQFKCKARMLEKVLTNSVHVIRMFGAGSQAHAKWFSDKPYGHLPTDAAVGAEMVGCLAELGMGDFTTKFIEQLIDEIPERLPELDDERKVAYLHGLARAIRLSPAMVGAPELAQAIEALGDPDVPVASWHDPRVVRQDLMLIVSSMGMPTEGLMTKLRWADVEEDSLAGHMQATRKAIGDRQGDVAWQHILELFKGADGKGFGSMDGGELDAWYAVGMLTIGRALLVDDHGESLNLFPGVSRSMVDRASETDTSWLPTRFGLLKSRAYHVGPKLFGNWTVFRETLAPERITVTLPPSLHPRFVKPGVVGGEATLIQGADRLVEMQPIQTSGQGIRFQVRVDPL